LAASLTGLSTIRAFGAQRVLEAEFDNYQNMHSSAFYMFISTSRPEAEQAINQERQVVGQIGLRLYSKYFKAGGGFFAFFVMMGFCVLSQGLASLGDYFLSYW